MVLRYARAKRARELRYNQKGAEVSLNVVCPISH